MHAIGTGETVIREPHNTAVGVLGRLGVPGLIVFITMMFQILRVSIWAARRTQHDQLLAPLVGALSILTLGTLVAGIGESPFVMPFYTVPFYFCAGVLARLAMRQTRVEETA